MTASVIDRPIFILAPPRSGSTLLYETLSRASQIWSLGDEGHGIIERHRELCPRPSSADSNRLLASHCTPTLGETIRDDFCQLVRDSEGRSLAQTGANSIRILEKTPKNILRIPFLLELFPDARFIYLVRDARDNISSIIDGWQSGRFITYSRQTRHGPWSFLLPPEWPAYTGDDLAGIAAFQWATCHRYAIQDLTKLDPSRWCALNYAEFIADTEIAVERLCQFMEVPVDDELRAHCRGELPTSRYTLSKPAAGKWRQHAQGLASKMAAASAMCQRVNKFIEGQSQPLATDLEIDLTTLPAPRKIGRNEPCPCGSKKKYKQCHGAYK